MLDPSREDILSLLSSMGIELPTTTKMSDSLLSKRLDRALDAAQYLTQVFPDNPDFATTGTGDVVKTGTIGLVNLPTWTEKNLKSALRRQTLKESLGMEDIEREERERTTGKIGPPPNLDPFHTLRSLIPILGEEVDGGSKEVMVEDAESSHAMFVKVMSSSLYIYLILSLLMSCSNINRWLRFGSWMTGHPSSWYSFG